MGFLEVDMMRLHLELVGALRGGADGQNMRQVSCRQQQQQRRRRRRRRAHILCKPINMKRKEGAEEEETTLHLLNP